MKILAVSKFQPSEKIRELYAKGYRSFGENYVQEALAKMEELQDLDIEWHLIGHLQKNKVKMVVGKFQLIHSVDSLELAQKINKLCEEKKLTQNILLQVNIAKEASKEGFLKETLMQQWPSLKALTSLRICGLMTMPPLFDQAEMSRPYFQQLRELLALLKADSPASPHPLNELSMGTSHDYQIAEQEGATIVRLGTILFGERPVKR